MPSNEQQQLQAAQQLPDPQQEQQQQQQQQSTFLMGVPQLISHSSSTSSSWTKSKNQKVNKNRSQLEQPSPFHLPKVDSFQDFTTAKRLKALTSHSSSTSSLVNTPSRSPTPSNLSYSLSPFPCLTPDDEVSLLSSSSSSPSSDSYQKASSSESILEPTTPTTTSFLRPGACLKGYQHSGHSVYDVKIDLKEVDLSQGYVNGTLTITGLTESHPEIVTFFKGELISENHSFITEDYDTSAEIDYAHWSRFPYFNKLGLNKHNLANYTHSGPLSHETLYMRWKEQFIYTDSKLESIEGASFAGFYYICFSQRTGDLKGYYYHKSSERFQKLELSYKGDSCNPQSDSNEICGFESYQFL